MSSTAETTRPVRLLRRVEYDALVEQGYLEGEGVELIDGQLVYASEEGPDHARTIRKLSRILFDAIPATEADIAVGNPIALNELSEPEPDLMVIPPGTYRGHHPDTASLVIEVSYSSRAYDLAVKARLYASAGYPDYWVVDLVRNEVVVHRDPQGEAYGDVQRHREGVLHPLHHPNVAIDVPGLFA